MVYNNGQLCVRTLKEVAQFFGCEEQTIRGWRVRTIPMPGVPGAWDLSAITQWRIAAEQRKRPRTEETALLDIISEPGSEDWKDRWVRGKALLTEEQLAQVRGQLVDLDEIGAVLRRTGTLLRDAIPQLETEYGSNAGDIMRLPVERFQEEVEALCGGDSDG